jgi:hypothetical protein
MTPATRTRYFSLWSKACVAKSWDSKDDDLRRDQVLFCMSEVRGPMVTTSSPAFGPNEITALFVYLDHIAHPDSLEKAAAWVDCMTDYRAYNKARQADWHEGQAYGRQGSGKLRRDRFAGQQKAAGETFEQLDPDAIGKRLMTMRARNARRTGYHSKPSPAFTPTVTAAPAVASAAANNGEGDPF